MSIQAEEAQENAVAVNVDALVEHHPGVPIAEFRKGLAEFLNRVRYQQERFPLARHDKNVATLVSTADSDTLYLIDRASNQFGVGREELVYSILAASEEKDSFGGVVSVKDKQNLDTLTAAANKLGITPEELLHQNLKGLELDQKVRAEREVCDS